MKFFIVGGNSCWVFCINECNGKILFRKLFSEKVYILIIRVVDLGFIENEVFLCLIILVNFIIFVLLFFNCLGDILVLIKMGNGVVEIWKGNGSFFLDIKMIIVIGVCVGVLLLSVCLIIVFCLKFRWRKNKDDDKCGSYYEFEISREDVLKVFKKMFY